MRKQKENWNDWQYYGLFLDKETRDGLILFLENCRWDYLYEELSKVYLDHCTLLHQAQYNEDPFVGNSIKYWLDCLLKFGCTRTQLLLSHVGYSDKAMAFKVIFLPTEMYAHEICFNETPHITIGTYKDGKPVDSNYITEWHEIEPIKIEAHLKLVYHYGKN